LPRRRPRGRRPRRWPVDLQRHPDGHAPVQPGVRGDPLRFGSRDARRQRLRQRALRRPAQWGHPWAGGADRRRQACVPCPRLASRCLARIPAPTAREGGRARRCAGTPGVEFLPTGITPVSPRHCPARAGGHVRGSGGIRALALPRRRAIHANRSVDCST
jgi:hypothetical protein